jgi:hypothetical protein
MTGEDPGRDELDAADQASMIGLASVTPRCTCRP